MRRCRGIKHLDECVNLEYLQAWGGPSVKDAIRLAIDEIQIYAERRIWHTGPFNIILPELHAKPHVIEFIFVELSRRFPNPTCIGIRMEDQQQYEQDMLIQFVPFTLKKTKNAIPVSWDDDLSDWTWQDVVDDGGQHYATSSKETWPPSHYVWKARIAASRNI